MDGLGQEDLFFLSWPVDQHSNLSGQASGGLDARDALTRQTAGDSNGPRQRDLQVTNGDYEVVQWDLFWSLLGHISEGVQGGSVAQLPTAVDASA